METLNTPDDTSSEHAEGSIMGAEDLTVVGVGAAEGGGEALTRLFEQTNPGSSLTYIVIATMPDEQLRRLADQIRRVTALDVSLVEGQTELRADHIYLVPLGRSLLFSEPTLVLGKAEPTPGQRVGIDLNLRAIAECFRERAIGVILSGAGSDGSLGLARIKEAGGATLAQEPGEATLSAMPRAAIATGYVDYVLPAALIPAQIVSFLASGQQLRLPAEPGPPDRERDALREILSLLRVRTGHDFTQYKRATIMRRVGRRMQFNGVLDLPSYLALLRERPAEIPALMRDMLISVTNFFRDPEVYQAIEALLPDLLAMKGPTDSVRAWVAGCATGEEAYSLAILLKEYVSALPHPPPIQIFATDIDETAITTAREGLFRDTIAADVSPERLRRFFNEEQGGYRIKKEIRDLILFAPHNLLRDPPFSRLDLVSCRNLLIYLDRPVQERMLELFHFVLRPEGRLILGASESAEGMPGLFTIVDKKHRIYARRTVAHSTPVLPSPTLAGTGPWNTMAEPFSPPRTLSVTELHQQLLEEYAPPSLIVNETYEIVHLSNRVGRYLQFFGGEPSHNLLKVIHPDLRLELHTALLRTAQRGRPSEVRRVRLSLDGQSRRANLTVRPVHDPEGARGYFLVLIEELDETDDDAAVLEGEEHSEPIVRQLDEELQRMREQLRLTIEQHETSTEELRASNEELQAINEELRSATEELETSKEELQSVNEELTTVNQELKNKVDEISRVNADLQNLMASTEIGTIFLDRDLRVKRFTPRVQDIFNLIATDLNRPLAHLTHQLTYPGLVDEAAQVVDRLTTIDREVQHADGRWFMARLLPYRTMENRIDGVVLTFIDITAHKQSAQALQEAKQQLEARVAERTAALEAEIAERRQSDATRRELMRRLVTAQEEERRRISREIHDQLGQQLAALLLGLRALKGISQGRAGTLAQIGQLEGLVGQISEEMGQLARTLRPTLLDDLGLTAALNAYTEEWSRRTGVAVAFHSNMLESVRLPPTVETTIYRVALEALLNVFKHARASQVSLILEQREDAAVAIIEDNGQGFAADLVLERPAQWGLGLLGMRERVELVGGTMTIESAEGAGTTVFVHIPIPRQQAEGSDGKAADLSSR